MCNCHKKKKRPTNAAAPTFAKASVLEDENPTLMEKVYLNLMAYVPEPIGVDVFMDDGKKKTLSLRHKDEVTRHLKLRIMQRAPGLFAADDPDWRYAGVDERASMLFEDVMTNV